MTRLRPVFIDCVCQAIIKCDLSLDSLVSILDSLVSIFFKNFFCCVTSHG
jgi:hypothetical protein